MCSNEPFQSTQKKNQLEHLVSGWFPVQEFPKSKLNDSVNIGRLEHVTSLEYIANWTGPFQVDHSAARGSGKMYFIPWWSACSMEGRAKSRKHTRPGLEELASKVGSLNQLAKWHCANHLTLPSVRFLCAEAQMKEEIKCCWVTVLHTWN